MGYSVHDWEDAGQFSANSHKISVENTNNGTNDAGFLNALEEMAACRVLPVLGASLAPATLRENQYLRGKFLL